MKLYIVKEENHMFFKWAAELIDAFIGKVVAVIGMAAQDFITDVFDACKINSHLSLIRPCGNSIPLFSIRHPEVLFSFASKEEIADFNGSLIKFLILLLSYKNQ
jgi:hypothetical protein